MRIFSVVLGSAFLFVSCFNCEPDIELGFFGLMDESHSFFPYSSSEVLRFIDQDSMEHTLRQKFFTDTHEARAVVDLLCSEAIIGGQEEYYRLEKKSITLTDTARGGYIEIILTTGISNLDDIDSSVVYDYLSMNCGTGPVSRISNRIITSIHEDFNNGQSPNEYLNIASFIGDTIINNTLYKDVYRGVHNGRGKTYYNKANGILLIYISEDDFLVLQS